MRRSCSNRLQLPLCAGHWGRTCEPAKPFPHVPVLPCACWLLDRQGSPTARSTRTDADQRPTGKGSPERQAGAGGAPSSATLGRDVCAGSSEDQQEHTRPGSQALLS